NEVIEYFQNKHEILIKETKVHIERQKSNIYIAISFSTHEENWETVVKETLPGFLNMYETIFLDYDSSWTFSTLKPNDDITNLENLYCILKYDFINDLRIRTCT
ncbi:hypothetical protein COBT_003199, partial [Conglomerata obtusa]